MSHALKSDAWQPTASIDTLKQRANLLRSIREFFYERKVLEVETPLLGKSNTLDPAIQSIPAFFIPFGGHAETCYLQTSPEFPMKRLLAAGSGSIYSLGKVFRNGEVGRKHNPEFTMLEWYRVGWAYHELMQEVDEFLQYLLKTESSDKIAYQEVFKDYLDCDPLIASQLELVKVAKNHGVEVQGELTRDDWLNVLFSHCIEPHLGKDKPVFIYNYPASQAALARINSEDLRVAERFEAFYQGMELANGFGELTDARVQRQRFEKELSERRTRGLPEIPIDEKLLAALAAGFPECSGVAMGIDRLFMLLLNKERIAEVLSFNYERL